MASQDSARFTDDESLTYTVNYTGAGTFNSSSFSFLGAPNDQLAYGPDISVAHGSRPSRNHPPRSIPFSHWA